MERSEKGPTEKEIQRGSTFRLAYLLEFVGWRGGIK